MDLSVPVTEIREATSLTTQEGKFASSLKYQVYHTSIFLSMLALSQLFHRREREWHDLCSAINSVVFLLGGCLVGNGGNGSLNLRVGLSNWRLLPPTIPGNATK